MELIIYHETTRSVIHRLAAFDVLRERIEELDQLAAEHFRELRSVNIVKSRIRSAAEQILNLRLRSMVEKRLDAWEPEASSLNNAAWEIVRKADSPAGQVAAALEGALEAVKLAGDESVGILNTLGAAQYRIGDFAGAIDTFARSREHYGTAAAQGMELADLPFLAMAYFRLGRTDAACESLARLKSLLRDPLAWPDSGSVLFQMKPLLAEADALIDPSCRQRIDPQSEPVTGKETQPDGKEQSAPDGGAPDPQ